MLNRLLEPPLPDTDGDESQSRGAESDGCQQPAGSRSETMNLSTPNGAPASPHNDRLAARPLQASPPSIAALPPGHAIGL